MKDKIYPMPLDLYYEANHHMWARLEPTHRVLIGIDTLGLESLGELAYINLHEVGTMVRRGRSIGTLEAAKMTGDLIAPVSGILVDRNEEVLSDPTLVNEEPYDRGWLVVIEPSEWETEHVDLIHGEALTHWVSSEIERYKSQGWIA